jgi:glycerol uptake facilitator-like aquaporin
MASTKAYLAETLGTGFLLATVIGSGIMGERLAGGNTAIALLGNTIPTGAILYVLITILAPISGAHFNPAVTLAFLLRGEIVPRIAATYVVLQIVGGVLGVWAAHIMFELPILQLSTTVRSGFSQGFSEVVASFGLLLMIFGGLRYRPDAIPALVGFYITAAYWFTASTSFANPAVTLARMLSDTFAGIQFAGAPLFILCQVIGAVLAVYVGKILFTGPETSPTE